jgi:cytochrome c-type biogenesis protein CcmF
MDAPIFSNADYLNLIKGTGLNPLLQNYWMTIHPPTLFLGFASTSIPFAFAMAGFMHKDHKGWLKPVLPWALFSGMILGTGILMGGAWAYEALSFGGYWAWDPVENMSLVPWLILIAGIHTNLIARNTGSFDTVDLFILYPDLCSDRLFDLSHPQWCAGGYFCPRLY